MERTKSAPTVQRAFLASVPASKANPPRRARRIGRRGKRRSARGMGVAYSLSRVRAGRDVGNICSARKRAGLSVTSPSIAVAATFPPCPPPLADCFPPASSRPCSRRSRELPDGPQWAHEIKHDGYRMVYGAHPKRTCHRHLKVVSWFGKY